MRHRGSPRRARSRAQRPGQDRRRSPGRSPLDAARPVRHARPVPAAIVVTPAVRAVDALIGVLARRGYTVIAPTVRDGAIVLDEVGGVADLPIGWSDDQEAATYRLHRNGTGSLFAYAVGPFSPRRYLSEPRRTLWSARRTDDGFELATEAPEPAPYAFVGVRGCELAAVAVQDHVLRDGAHPDVAYSRRACAGLLRRCELRSPRRDLLLHVHGHRPGDRDRP